MKLIELQIINFRNITELKLKINKIINIIYGGNAQGKTSILEAIYLLGITKSFRVSEDRSLVKQDRNYFDVKGVFQKETKDLLKVRIFFSYDKGKNVFVDNEKLKSFSLLIGKVPVILLSLEDLDLTYGSPSFRRRFINILLSQIDASYLQALKQLNKILKNRNKLLSLIKDGIQKPEALVPWDLQLSEYASYLCFKRKEAVEEINPLINDFYREISGRNDRIEIKYQTFFDLNVINSQQKLKEFYLTKLAEIKERDINYGSTTIGPHRDDLVFFKNDDPIKIFGSQGENKTFLISLKFTEALFIEKAINEKPILLLDDIFSELDLSRVHKVVEQITKMQNQTFITTTDLNKFGLKMDSIEIWTIHNGQVSYEA